MCVCVCVCVCVCMCVCVCVCACVWLVACDSVERESVCERQLEGGSCVPFPR